MTVYNIDELEAKKLIIQPRISNPSFANKVRQINIALFSTGKNYSQLDEVARKSITLFALICELNDFMYTYFNILEEANQGIITLINDLIQHVDFVLDESQHVYIYDTINILNKYLDEKNSDLRDNMLKNKKNKLLYNASLSSNVAAFETNFLLREFNNFFLKLKLFIFYLEINERIRYDEKCMFYAKFGVILGALGLFVGILSLLI